MTQSDSVGWHQSFVPASQLIQSLNSIVVRLGAKLRSITIMQAKTARGEPQVSKLRVVGSEPRRASGSQPERQNDPGRNRDDRPLLAAVNILSVSFVLWDAQGRLVQCNDKFRAFFKIPEQRARPGMTYEEVMAAAAEPLAQYCGNGFCSSGLRSDSYEVLLSDDRWLNISEQRTADGGYVSVGTDITRLKRSEQRLTDRERELKATVTDLRNSRHALELQKQQLVDLTEKYAQEKTNAEEASRAKSEFLANISHELRTPLNAVIGFSEIMLSGVLGPTGSPKYAEYARDIHESGKYLLDVINDILDMSRIEAGQMNIVCEPLDAVGIVGDCLRVISKSAKDQNIALHYEGADSLEMQGDRRAVKQVLLNLLSNAVKFTPEGGEVRVEARMTEAGPQLVIADTGIGIPREALQTLGRPFEQVENQFTKSHKGTGLGLAISRSLVEVHGGHMEIESEVDKGTTVTCQFPPAEPASKTNDDERAAA